MATAPYLRPKSFIELIDGSFRLYRSHFVTFIAVIGVVYIPIAIAQLLNQVTLGADYMRAVQRLSSGRFVPGASPFSGLPIESILIFLGVSVLLGLLQGLLVQTLGVGALANAIGRSYLGEPVSVASAYQAVLKRFGALVGAALLIGLVTVLLLTVLVGLPVGLLVASSLGSDSRGGAGAAVFGVLLLFLTGLLCVVLAVVVGVRFLFATQAIVLEGQGPVAGLRRSWALSRGSFFRIFGIVLAMAMIVMVVGALPAQVVIAVLTLIFSRNPEAMIWITTLNLAITQIFTLVAMPLQLVLQTLLYYDLRVRNEGFDLELRSLDQQPAAEAAAQ
jgi:hypothetical protein